MQRPLFARPRTARAAAAVTAGLALTLTAFVPSGTAPASATTSNVAATTQTVADKKPDPPANVRPYRVRDSILGVHRWYQQYKHGHPVYGGWWAWHRNTSTGEVTIYDGRQHVGKVAATAPTLSSSAAAVTAAKQSSVDLGHVTGSHLVVLAASPERATSRLVWAVDSISGSGSRTSFVDAHTGTVIKTVLNSKFDRSPKLSPGLARVFDPNPVVELQDESLRDRHDAADAVPPGGYTNRPLPRLVGKGHTLVGMWATIINKDRVTSPTATYKYNRSNDKFEQVMGYYALDSEQAYLQRLGFTDANAESQKIATDAFSDDNSFYVPSSDKIVTGRGGVDDAEDPEVTWHEYGHALQDDQVPNWGLAYQGSAMGEGFGDYMAVTMSQRFGKVTATTPAACVMDWDATSYTRGRPHCLRRTDSTKVYPDDMDSSNPPDPHADGEIWSRALWDMNLNLGRNKATRIIVEAQFWMNPRSKFKDAAQTIVDTATALYPDDTTVADTTLQAFVDRGILS